MSTSTGRFSIQSLPSGYLLTDGSAPSGSNEIVIRPRPDGTVFCGRCGTYLARFACEHSRTAARLLGLRSLTG